ncbi:MAG: UDP-N-acetylmuramoyl-L-alanyl-D-glutamate--2,6-diaminopimelate ligase, partial [Endomicrobia bacterium]|nr:UDP-N-acetylmuramoyl-L-alanyl-D-glutamate--2,6-diaminopimelate ligase [Endomicrobiia bacterium]
GRKYIKDAVLNGAAAVVSDKKDDTLKITQLIVEDVFRFMSLFSAEFYRYPDKELTVIGITGTNGKTTVTYMIESILAQAGMACGVIGTINYRYGGKIINAPNTTPQSADIYKMMREMADGGIKYLAMEVSSHSLALGRVRGIEFDIAVFTNLSQDHLDFHKDMESYFEAKSLLFKGLGASGADIKKSKKYAIINADDKYGKKLSKINTNSQIVLYSAKEQDAGFKAENILLESSCTEFDIVYRGCGFPYSDITGQAPAAMTKHTEMRQIGLHNVYNALASVAACVFCGVPFEKAAEAVKFLPQVPGRLEAVDASGAGFEIVIDFAHTQDAMVNVISAIKKLNPKRIITVFGCGGDRDRAKRPLMGKTAVEMSDFVFVTSDNPRKEDPKQIILDIEVGIKRAGKNNYKIIPDRETAIKDAVAMADKGDIVLLAGKGHETSQIIGTEKLPFNDKEIAAKYLRMREERKKTQRKSGQEEFNF